MLFISSIVIFIEMINTPRSSSFIKISFLTSFSFTFRLVFRFTFMVS